MKVFFTLMISGILVSTGAFASSIVCSNENLYYSKTAGINPNTSDSEILLYKGEVLLKVPGDPRFPGFPMKISLEGEKRPLKQEGDETSGTSIFQQTIVLNKIQPPSDTNHSGHVEIGRENDILCRQIWP